MGTPPRDGKDVPGRSADRATTTSDPSWKEAIAPFQRSDAKRSVWQLANTLIPYFGLWYVAYICLDISYWATLGVSTLAALFLVRSFIIAHDCGHGSFFRSNRANAFWGSITSILSFLPYFAWRHEHALHHARSGDLDNRGAGDIMLLTVEEYRALSRWGRFKYRIYRNPLILLVVGPLYIFLLSYRFWTGGANARSRRSVIRNNLALLAVFALAHFTIGLKSYVLVQLPIIALAGVAGLWMFYIQHQFEGVQWDRHKSWSYFRQATEGSSYYALPKILQWFTGNIGFHHVHHLGARIPNYFLEKCHNEVALFRSVKPITFWESLHNIRFTLWDEDRRKLVTFSEVSG